MFPTTSPLNTLKQQGQALRRYHPSWDITPNAQAGTGRAGQGPHKSLNFNASSTELLGQDLVLPLPPELGLCSQLLEGSCTKFILKRKKKKSPPTWMPRNQRALNNLKHCSCRGLVKRKVTAVPEPRFACLRGGARACGGLGQYQRLCRKEGIQI